MAAYFRNTLYIFTLFACIFYDYIPGPFVDPYRLYLSDGIQCIPGNGLYHIV